MRDLLEFEESEQGQRVLRAAERVIQLMHRKQDNSAIIHEMHERFPSAEAMLRGDRYLWECMGMKPADALLMGMSNDVCRYVRRDSFGKRPKINTLSKASAYLEANAHGLRVECFFLICVNRIGNLKARVLLQKGTDDSALFSLRMMLAEVIRVSPTAVILSHNHPGGTLRPSAEDIACTEDALNGLSALNVPLLDHIIIAGGEAVSMRYNGFIPESRWISQNPKNRMLRQWVDIDDDLPPPPPRKSTKKKSEN